MEGEGGEKADVAISIWRRGGVKGSKKKGGKEKMGGKRGEKRSEKKE